MNTMKKPWNHDEYLRNLSIPTLPLSPMRR